MADAPFHDPHVGISRVYTKTGDAGETGIVGGHRLPKDDRRIEAYGTVDEANAWVGLARAAALDSGPRLAALAADLLRVQHQLFNLGSELSTRPADLRPGQPRVADADVAWLEARIDADTARLPPLRSFVLPGAGRVNSLLHLARTVSRRAERAVVPLVRAKECDARCMRYLNRLSDALFTWSRAAALDLGIPETLWEPNKA